MEGSYQFMELLSERIIRNMEVLSQHPANEADMQLGQTVQTDKDICLVTECYPQKYFSS